MKSVFQSSRRDIPIESAKGIRLATSEGNEWIDALSGIFTVNYGYSCTPIIDAIKHQLESFCFLPKQRFVHPSTQSVVTQLLNSAGLNEDGAALLLTSGSEAIEAALSISSQSHCRNGEPERKKTLSRYQSYHGATLGARALTGRPEVFRLATKPIDIIHFQPPFDSSHPIAGEYGPHCLGSPDAIRSIIEMEGPSTIANLVLEPVNHLRGMLPSPPGYLKAIRELCDDYGIHLVLDEIITGCGRTGSFSNAQSHSIVPDIAVLGKGLSGGYVPLSAVLVNSDIADPFRDKDGAPILSHSHTYATHPVGIAALGASMAFLDGLMNAEDWSKKHERFRSHVNELMTIHKGVIREVRVEGLLAGIAFHESAGAPPLGTAITESAFRNGLIIRGEEEWIALAPALVVTDADLDTIFSRLSDVISAADRIAARLGPKVFNSK